jgi:hypothetical protein
MVVHLPLWKGLLSKMVGAGKALLKRGIPMTEADKSTCFLPIKEGMLA